MLIYLQGNTHPEISIATHQLAQFCQDSRLSHEQATTRLGRYLAHSKDRGIVYEPDIHGHRMLRWCRLCRWLEYSKLCHVDKVMSRTGFVITYANWPIYWASCLQTEIALSTAKAEYIAMSSALGKVIPLMTHMKELHTIFWVHINKPNSFCKVHEDNQSTIRVAKSEKFTPRTKHTALKYHHFCSHVKNGHIEISYPTEDQKADLLTKPLADAEYFRLRHMLIGW